MTTRIYWFRNDLRLSDNRALARACRQATRLLPVYCHGAAFGETTRWGFARVGVHRRRILRATIDELSARLAARGSGLVELSGPPQDVLPQLARAVGARDLSCEAIAAPEEDAELEALRAAGLAVDTTWQSSLLDPSGLPFAATELPDVFSAFRRAVEHAGVVPPAPQPPPADLPPLPDLPAKALSIGPVPPPPAGQSDPRSSFPYWQRRFSGGEAAAHAHLEHYFARRLAHTYKATRNGLTGIDYSSKFSPWLASGALSARAAHAALKQFEDDHGANEGSYWLWFELLWRDYFRFLHLKHGRRLYRAGGLAGAGVPPHDAAAFARWRRGETGEPLIDAGMRELAATGYLSNRLRQVVASYLIHDLACDWRAGAAWFESQLVDYDVYSNQGNWLYLAGRGTDPRGGRRFDPARQARAHDPDGRYRALWGSA